MSVSTHFGDAPQPACDDAGGRLGVGAGGEYSAPGPRASVCQQSGLPTAGTWASSWQAPGIYLLVEDTTELSWPEAAERRLGPAGPGKATSQGVRLHSLVAA